MPQNIFGTDGVRGVANADLSCDLAFRLGRAATKFLGPDICIGRDTRLSGTMLESALTAGIMAEGGRPHCCGVIPTPAVALLTVQNELDGGIVISASHNPPEFNGIKFFLISPRELAVPDYMRAFMREHEMWFTEVTGLEAVIPQLDVLYMTRIQKERFVDPLEYERNKGIYVLTRRKLERARPDMLVMHPLPRVDEITVDVDDDPRAVYFQQARYGMFARMALLEHLALQPRDEHPAPVEIGTRPICRNPRCITQTEHYLPPLVKKIGGVDCCGFCDAALE